MSLVSSELRKERERNGRETLVREEEEKRVEENPFVVVLQVLPLALMSSTQSKPKTLDLDLGSKKEKKKREKEGRHGTPKLCNLLLWPK